MEIHPWELGHPVRNGESQGGGGSPSQGRKALTIQLCLSPVSDEDLEDELKELNAFILQRFFQQQYAVVARRGLGIRPGD